MGTSGATVQDWDGYASQWSRTHGGSDPRNAFPLLRLWRRVSYLCGRGLARLPVNAATLAGLALAACLCVPLLLLAGPTWGILAGGLVAFTALAESLDEVVSLINGHHPPHAAPARGTGTAKRLLRRFVRVRALRLRAVLLRAYHSAAGRVGEACWLAGLWLLGAPGWLTAATWAVTVAHEYGRLQAVRGGVNPVWVTTVGDRPMRIMVAAAGLTLAGAAALITVALAVGAATMAVTIWLMLTVAGLVQLADLLQRVPLAVGADERS